MATNKEKELLIETLKFTPRTYKISMWGYGGEKVMGTVDPKVWDYCMENQVNLQDIAWNSDICEEIDLDPELLPFPAGSWYECDGMSHVNGVSRDAGTLQIEDENGEIVFEKSLDECDGCDDSPELFCEDEVWVGSRKKGEVVFVGSSNEKGTFFEGEIELTAPFDITKLGLHYDDFDGEDIVSGVSYNGEDIDNWGGSTDGKSSDFNMVRLIDDEGHWERYEPGEKDWGHPESGPSPSDWEKSPAFDFKKHKPVHVGWYNCTWGNYGTTHGSAYWNGEHFGEWEHGKFDQIDDAYMKEWQGYNWDTSSWANQPPDPPDAKCKCGWIGNRDAMTVNDDTYDYECPECKSTKFEWLDYDPTTPKGRKNRERYCVPAMPTAPEVTEEEEAQLIALLDQALDDLAKESGIEFEDRTGETVAPKDKWPF